MSERKGRRQSGQDAKVISYVGFTASRIVVIESLEHGAVKTGLHLYEFLDTLEQGTSPQIPVEYLQCESARDFLVLLDSMVVRARVHGDSPIVHVEAHGDSDGGLEFANGSMLSWQELSSALLTLNIATKFNLVTVFAACHGGRFLSEVSPVRPAQCFAFVAPTAEVDDSELFRGFMTFYRTFLASGDMGRGTSVLRKQKLSAGSWVALTMEQWYEQVIIHYITQFTKRREIKKSARNVRRQLLKTSTHVSVGRTKRNFKLLQIHQIRGGYFNAFFSTKELPNNFQRFAVPKARVMNKALAILSKREHKM